MFGFDGETKGLKIILERIASNDDSGKLTHKDVRAYARCILAIFESLSIDTKIEAEIKLLLAALCKWHPHYDRSFMASRILELLEQNAKLKIQETSNESFKMNKIANIPEPDPSWDYYLTYHTLLKAKSKLNKLIDEISEFETASATQDEYFQEELSKIVNTLNSTLPKIETE